MIFTSLCNLLGTTHPIIQAGMGGIAGPKLAAAVSEAGAMGIIGVYRLSPLELRKKLQEAKKLSNKPLGVNFVPDVLTLTELEQGIAICLAEKIQFFSFFSHIPPHLIAKLHQANAIVFVQVGSMEQAQQAINTGIDGLIVQGWEAGGHLRGETAEMALLPLLSSISRRWTNIPLIAAGGIATGQGLVAALAVGGVGVWLGTSFVVATESDAHPSYQQKIISSKAQDTVVTTKFDQGWTNTSHRVLRNKVTESSDALPPSIIGFAEVAGRKVPILLGSVAVPTRFVSGEIDAMAHYSGQSCELIDIVEPASKIIHRIIAEAEETIRYLSCQVRLENKTQNSKGGST